MTAAAYVLMQELRLRVARTACARTQVSWLRDRLLKLGAHVVVSVRRMVGVAPAAQHAGPRRLAAHRPRPRCPRRIETPTAANSQSPQHGGQAPLGDQCRQGATFIPEVDPIPRRG